MIFIELPNKFENSEIFRGTFIQFVLVKNIMR